MFAKLIGGSGYRASANAESATTGNDIVLDPFAERQFMLNGSSSSLIDHDAADFVKRINILYEEGGKKLVDGYAPFCKHLFVPNFTPANPGAVKITTENEHLLRSGYQARTDKELAVLTRWFPKSALPQHLPQAKYLDIILYSREQIKKEREAKGDDPSYQEEAPWGIVSVKPTDFP